MKFGSQLIHGYSSFCPNTGASSTPIFQASTYHQPDIDCKGKYGYSRMENPTREALEEAIANMEGGSNGFAFASGMAAITAVFMLFEQGDHLVICEDVYGGTFQLATRIMPKFGIEATFVDATDLDAMEKAIRPNTKAIYLETPSNPTLRITDVRKASTLAKKYDLLTIIDNTFMTPYYQRPFELGADIIIHSATKFINGHSDVVAGLVVTKTKELGEQVGFIQINCGSVLGIQDCWLTLRGLKTLKARMDHSVKSAGIIAEWLSERPEVKKVYYPGLETHEGYEIHQEQASSSGAVLSFDVGSKEQVKKLFDAVKIGIVAISLGGVESIYSYPAQMSHASMTKEERDKLGITEGLIRLSVGLEDTEDILDNLEQAFAQF
ncbi:trans-sulfuration enzyme family protein [Brevibacillus daliensis]|uniref:trans-sulfuration enzyme family protein n=1 Tax=Brevibacillus daliensis TaxID=2892995 RepID=UPI001E5372E0|nr:aminotransferase class I/II-fold pyridoxal phosphate-dependent enzyme [Brevibacillus daliensis]